MECGRSGYTSTTADQQRCADNARRGWAWNRQTFGLVRRVERILHPLGVAAKGRGVLVAAFNRVIAEELQQEIGARLKTFEHNGDPAIRTIHALCVQVIGEELRLLLPHERDAMVYDLLQEFPSLKERYKTAKKAHQALRANEARHV